MDTFADIQAAVQSDLNIGSESTLFDPTVTIPLAVNRGYRKCAGLYRWPATRDAKKTSTISGQEYYDYPANWRPDSIWKVRVDGNDLGDPLTLKDYYYEQEQNYPAGNKTIWANQNGRFLITINGLPPQTNGDNNIELWGFNFAAKLINPTDTTIFSSTMPDCNEAVEMEALAILRVKGGEQPVRLMRYVQGALLLSMEAQQILSTAWSKVLMEEAKQLRTTRQWILPDYFPTGINRINSKRFNIGNF